MLPHVSALNVGHQLRMKHAGALTNKKTVQQVGVNFTYVITLLYRTYVAVYTFQEREGDTKLPHYEYVAVIPENRRECRLGYKDTLQLPYTCQFYKPISAR